MRRPGRVRAAYRVVVTSVDRERLKATGERVTIRTVHATGLSRGAARRKVELLTTAGHVHPSAIKVEREMRGCPDPGQR